MGKQVTLDYDVVQELIRKAIQDDVWQKLLMWGFELNFTSKQMSDVLREVLKLNITDRTSGNSGDNYPTSRIGNVQQLLDRLRDTVFSISKNGMEHKGKKWVANPNVVAITVQDARAHNLRITVYGRPDEFAGIKNSLEIKSDMSGYSRFVLDSEGQLPSAIKVINHSYELKRDRGRL